MTIDPKVNFCHQNHKSRNPKEVSLVGLVLRLVKNTYEEQVIMTF
jgi:hypothetical protein